MLATVDALTPDSGSLKRQGVPFGPHPRQKLDVYAPKDAANLPVRPDVAPIATSEYPTPARRPLNSALDCRKIARVYGIVQPDWRAGLNDVLKELETAQ